MKDECDINTIVERFGVTGELPSALSINMAILAVSDYHSAINAVRAAEESFMALPAKLRARFDHDPNALLQFLQNEQNRDEAIQLGLIDGNLWLNPSFLQ